MEVVLAHARQVDVYYVLASAVAQQVFAMLWFGCIVHHLDHYYRAADKGVRRLEHSIHRYPPFFVSLTCFVSAVMRSLALLMLIQVCGAKTLYDYENVAVVVALMGFTSIYRHFSCQRPFQLLVTEGGFEIAACMVASVVCFFMKQYGF